MTKVLDVSGTFDEFLEETDWRVKENSSSIKCLGALNKYIVGKATALYWEQVYDEVDVRIMQAHRSGDIHIHDLGSYSSYCIGLSLRDLLREGIHGVDNISISKPASRLRSICAQIANIATVIQNEVAGAVAFSSWNVLLSPFVYFDTLRDRKIDDNGQKINIEYSEKEIENIYKSVESMVFQLNSNSRFGSDLVFSNFSLDFSIPQPLKSEVIILSGKQCEGYIYSDFQKESDLLLKVFCKILTKGDALNKPFAYPIPTFNIDKDMRWNDYSEVFELAAKTGAPYFGNFISSDMKSDDVYSMCCRLRLDLKELTKKTGGLFGSSEKTGSIGVVTVNLPAIGYRNKTKEDFFSDLKDKMELGYQQLIEKRKVIQKEFDKGLYPALKVYLGRLTTLFNTIGLVGGHEMCLNFLGKGIETKEGRDFSLEVVNFMRDVLLEFQEKSGLMFNLEYTPAESTAYRFALKDIKRYEGIATAGIKDVPYYTNSMNLPVGLDWNYKEIYEHQNGLLSLATGGSVLHNFLDGFTTAQMVEDFVKIVFTNYDIPYMSFSPVYTVCNDHGTFSGFLDVCPKCGGKVESFQRVTGYTRSISRFNNGKAQEFKERYQHNLVSEVEKL